MAFLSSVFLSWFLVPYLILLCSLTWCEGNTGCSGLNAFIKDHECPSLCEMMGLSPLDDTSLLDDDVELVFGSNTGKITTHIPVVKKK